MNATYIVTVYVVIDDVLKAIGHVDDSRTVISSARDLIQLALEVQVTLVVSPTVLRKQSATSARTRLERLNSSPL